MLLGDSDPQANLKFVGSHAGVSIGEDGPSQMGLEDIAMFRSILTLAVLHPCDAVSTERLVEAAAAHEGIVYLRTMRQDTPVIYDNEQAFPHRWQQGAAAVAVRVIDAYSIQPIDVATVREAADATGAIVTVEDHYPAGGLGEAVLQALAERPVPVTVLAVRQTPMSGTGEELRDLTGISAAAIIKTVERLVTRAVRGRP